MVDGYSVDVFSKEKNSNILSYEYDDNLKEIKMNNDDLLIELIENGSVDNIVKLMDNYNVNFNNEKDILISCISNNKHEIADYLINEKGYAFNGIDNKEISSLIKEYDCDEKKFLKVFGIEQEKAYTIDLPDSGIKFTFEEYTKEKNQENLLLLQEILIKEVKKDLLKIDSKFSEKLSEDLVGQAYSKIMVKNLSDDK